MKKFLAVFDGYKISDSTLQYAIELTKLADAHLVGVFLEEFIYRNYNVYEVITTVINYEKEILKLDAKDKETRDQSVKRFEDVCREAGIDFSVHRDTSIALQELKLESMFADLILINEHESFTVKKESSPTHFMKDLLGDVQCPVIVVPDKFQKPEKIVLLYDGRPSCLFALKMFSYLFSALKEIPIEVFTVQEDGQLHNNPPESVLMREFMERHFPTAQLVIKYGNPEKEIPTYLKSNTANIMLVLGAYRRNEMSRFFKVSMADILQKELDVPLFIAHNK